MHDILPHIDKWRANGEAVALATVIQTWGSAPRGVGAKMAMTAAGAMAGSVSGGCVEGAVFEAALEVLATGRPQLLHFGVADEAAWEVGLACGGTIEVFVEQLDMAIYDFLRSLISEERAGATVTIIQGPDEQLGQKLALGQDGRTIGALGAEMDSLAVKAVQESGRSHRLALSDSIELFVERIGHAPVLVMVGGVHIAVALTSIAKTLGYRTIVVDPRRAFGSQQRFPHVDRLIQAWPDKAFAEIELTPETAVAMLTHDPKIDDPALKVVLNSPAFYVGALGSQKTQAKRRQRLLQAGLTEAQLDRLHAPIGLDIKAQTPEEIALAIMAEIVGVKGKQ